MKTKVDISLKSEVYDCLYDNRGEEEGNGKGLGHELPRSQQVERGKDRIGS